jgi:hypothetical protein
MHAIVNVAEITSAKESDRQFALLNWARLKIDGIASRRDACESIDELLDFMAHFTREYFGYQERLLKEAAVHDGHLMQRKATHAEFRRRLAHIYADAVNGHANVPARLDALCHELWLDILTQRDEFSALVHSTEPPPKFRHAYRHDSKAFQAILRADS